MLWQQKHLVEELKQEAMHLVSEKLAIISPMTLAATVVGICGHELIKMHVEVEAAVEDQDFVYNSTAKSNYPSGCKLNDSFYLTDSSTLSRNNEFPNINSNVKEERHQGNKYVKVTPLLF